MSNSIEKLAKEAERLAESLKRNPFSAFDQIAKDIQDRQDNAIAMEFTKCIGELLRKNGVVPKLTEYTRNFETDKTFETRYGVSIDELDFSEHDKVFEDKIAELENIINNKLGGWDKRGITYQEIMDMKAENQELKQITKGYEDKIAELKKDYKTASELLGKYQQENEALKKRIDELENFSCQAEQETESLVEKLKQRIAELESKETEKPTKINLNDRIKVKLTPLGAEIYYNRYDFLKSSIRAIGGVCTEPKMPKIDEDGYTEMTMWQFIELYGKDIGKINREVINPLDIIIAE